MRNPAVVRGPFLIVLVRIARSLLCPVDLDSTSFGLFDYGFLMATARLADDELSWEESDAVLRLSVDHPEYQFRCQAPHVLGRCVYRRQRRRQEA